MLLTILSSWVYVEKRELLEVIPKPLREIWNDWEVRVMVLMSLFLQISLTRYGSRRKHNVRMWIRVFLWFAYLVADWVATVALGVLSSDKGNRCSCHDDNEHDKPVSALAAFWGPFLLLHLGGPDTITAYALEDNELWMRHLLGLTVQSGVALYIFLMVWDIHSWISYLSIPVLISGFIKYIERVLVLRSANREQFRDSMLTCPDPGPNYEKFMEELCIRRAEGHFVDVAMKKDFHLDVKDHIRDSQANMMVKAHSLFQNFKRLFVDLILSFRDRDESQACIRKLKADQAFQVVEIELGFAYDVFYTKAPFIYTYWGCIFRVITISSTAITFVLFVIFESDRDHDQIDLGITYTLLAGAIGMEVYAALLIASSDWTSLSVVDNPSSLYPRIMSFLHKQTRIMKRKRWSNSVAQFNLLSYCLRTKEKTKGKCLRPFGLMRWVFNHIEQLEMLWYQTHDPIKPELKESIFSHFEEKSKEKSGNEADLVSLCSMRGGDHLRDKDCPNSITISEWTTEIEFDQSILIWHIATDLLFHSKDGHDDGEGESLKTRRVSKIISDYMLYLQVMCPYMLPFGIGLIRFRDTMAEARHFFEERSPVEGEEKFCKMLGEVNTCVPPKQVKGDRSKSVLFDACRLASKLSAWEVKTDKKWKLVSEVWMEMLGYAANHCRGNFHAQQLRRGGELLTHVWLLMAHLGITEQIQISKGHARAMLIAK